MCQCAELGDVILIWCATSCLWCRRQLRLRSRRGPQQPLRLPAVLMRPPPRRSGCGRIWPGCAARASRRRPPQHRPVVRPRSSCRHRPSLSAMTLVTRLLHAITQSHHHVQQPGCARRPRMSGLSLLLYAPHVRVSCRACAKCMMRPMWREPANVQCAVQELRAAQGAAQVALAHARRELESKQAAAEQAAHDSAALRRALAEARGAVDELRGQLQRRSAEAQRSAQVPPPVVPAMRACDAGSALVVSPAQMHGLRRPPARPQHPCLMRLRRAAALSVGEQFQHRSFQQDGFCP